MKLLARIKAMKLTLKQRYELIFKPALKVWLNSFVSGKVRKKIRLLWFIFKWFLIGKYHCNLPQWTRKVWWIAHKLLWFSIAFSVAVTLETLRKAFL